MRTGNTKLSPAQHGRIRRHLALIPAYICLVSGWTNLLSRLPIGRGAEAHLLRDFVGTYMEGLIALRHDASALYDMDRRAAILADLLPQAANLRYAAFYGPQISVLFSPLARLPYPTAMAVWMCVSLAIYLACGYAVWRACPRLRDCGYMVGLLLLADPALYYMLSFVHISAVALLCVTVAFFALRAQRPVAAGVAIGSLAYKPTYGLAMGVVFLWASFAPAPPTSLGQSQERRIVLGAIAGAAIQYMAAAIFWGPAILVEYVRGQGPLIPDMRDQFYIHALHSWRSFFEILGVPETWAIGAYVFVAGLLMTFAFRCWRSSAPLGVRYAVLLITTVVANPHIYVYDLVILMPAFLLLWDWSETFRARTVGEALPAAPSSSLRRQSFTTMFEWLLYFCYFSPSFAVIAVVAHVQLSVPALTLLGIGAAAMYLSHFSPQTVSSESQIH